MFSKVTKPILSIAYIIIALYLCYTPLYGQTNSIRKHASFSLQSEPTVARKGEEVRLVLQATIDAGWHIYSLHLQGEDMPPPTKVKFITSFTKSTPVYETRPIHQLDKVIGVQLDYHEEKAFFYQNVTIPKEAQVKNYLVQARITYQTCSNRVCFPPVTDVVKTNVPIENGTPRKKYTLPNHAIDTIYYTKAKVGLLSSLSSFITLALLMGLVSLLAPCVFPMVPLIFGFFTKKANEKPLVIAKLSLLFCSGIFITFILLGTIASLLFGASLVVSLASSVWTNIAIGLLFVVFALQLTGVLTINVIPLALQQILDRKAREQKGGKGIFLMGVAFAVTSFTCSVPFVGTLLVSAANGAWIYPLIGMFFYALAFAFPFFVLTWLPRFLVVFRRDSGVFIWIPTIRVLAGIIEIGLAIKFFSNADLVANTHWLSRDSILASWAILLVLFCLYTLYTFFYPFKKKNKYTLSHKQKAIASLLLVSVFLLALWLAKGIGGYSRGGTLDSILPPQPMKTNRKELISFTEQQKRKWLPTLNEARNIAKKTNQPIFVDFSGYSCVNCRWMEQNVLIRKDVDSLLQNMIRVRLYTDGGKFGKANLAYQIKKLHTVALPFYVILTKDETIIATFSGLTRDSNKFIQFLQQAKQVQSKSVQ